MQAEFRLPHRSCSRPCQRIPLGKLVAGIEVGIEIAVVTVDWGSSEAHSPAPRLGPPSCLWARLLTPASIHQDRWWNNYCSRWWVRSQDREHWQSRNQRIDPSQQMKMCGYCQWHQELVPNRDHDPPKLFPSSAYLDMTEIGDHSGSCERVGYAQTGQAR